MNGLPSRTIRHGRIRRGWDRRREGVGRRLGLSDFKPASGAAKAVESPAVAAMIHMDGRAFGEEPCIAYGDVSGLGGRHAALAWDAAAILTVVEIPHAATEG